MIPYLRVNTLTSSIAVPESTLLKPEETYKSFSSLISIVSISFIEEILPGSSNKSSATKVPELKSRDRIFMGTIFRP